MSDDRMRAEQQVAEKFWRVSGLRNDESFSPFGQDFSTEAEANTYFDSERKSAKYIALYDLRPTYLA